MNLGILTMVPTWVLLVHPRQLQWQIGCSSSSYSGVIVVNQ